MQDERNLRIWKDAVALSKDVYLIKYPPNEQFGLQNQIRRAVTSISLNIGEGSARETPADYIHFLVIARGSCKEVQTAIELTKELGMIDFQTYTNLYDKADKLGRMITAFIKVVREGGKNGKK
jgi:four helix bundle protein